MDDSYFAPAGRASPEEIEEQVRRTLDDPCIKVLLDAAQGMLAVLNPQRQILAANRELLDGVRCGDPECIAGLRLGEAVNCVHFTEGPDGCGSSARCRGCGAVIAILASQSSKAPVTGECHLSVYRDGALAAAEFAVRCSPLHVAGYDLTAVVLRDISAEKRRDVLEHAFLYDLMNTIGGLEGWIARSGTVDAASAARSLVALSATLKDEVVSYRTIYEAEQGKLAVRAEECDAGEILEYLRAEFERHPAAVGKHLEIVGAHGDTRFRSDRTLLLRVLVHMLTNAFEAAPEGDAISITYTRDAGAVEFAVANPGMIPPEAQHHIFERSFSTKSARGRGLGTYSMKLLGERYLRGSVTFTSGIAAGTRFAIRLPDPKAVRHVAVLPAATVGKRLLLVEDQETVRRLAELFLKRLGCQVTTCSDGMEGMTRLTEAPGGFDIAMTDLQMPGMDGIEFARRVSAMCPGLPVLLCTGMRDPAVLDTAAAAGIRGVVAKPFTLQSLAEALASLKI